MALSFRNLWGKEKRAQLLDEADKNLAPEYKELHPALELGLPFQTGAVESNYLSWPLLPELFPVSFPGVKTSRDDVVVDIDKERLISRMKQYFDPELGDAEIRALMPSAMTNTARFDARKTRQYLVKRGFRPENIVRYCYRPFDNRWLYWEPETKLLDEKRSEYFPQVLEGNIFLFTTGRTRKGTAEPPLPIRTLNDLNCMDSGARGFALYLRPDHGDLVSNFGPQPNLGKAAIVYLTELQMKELQLLEHATAIISAPVYRRDNESGLRSNWPRIPLPSSGGLLDASALLGKQLTALLDTDVISPGVTSGNLRPEMRAIGTIVREGGGSLDPDAGDLDLNAGWGHGGKGGAVMPGKGKVVERDYTAKEREAIATGTAALGLSEEQVLALLGNRTLDVYLNNIAYWRNIPIGVWEYTIGGYQATKKWLSYCAREILGRALKMDEARAVTDIARRIAAILLMEPELDANYEAIKKSAYPWKSSS